MAVLEVRTLPTLLTLAAVLAAASCTPVGETKPVRVTVQPGGNVQAVVDRVPPGSTIVLSPGVYTQGVKIGKPGIRLYGVDRNEVIFDGGGEIGNGIHVTAEGVTVANLTVRNFRFNGVLVSGWGDWTLSGFRVSHVTAHANGLYGVYAFQASNGVIEDSWASGHADSGFYVGQCGERDEDGNLVEGCNVTLRRVKGWFNAVGYEGTNASGVRILDCEMSHNRVGITPNSQSVERKGPSEDVLISGCLVEENRDVRAPEQASGAWSVGIAVGGAKRVTLEGNVVRGHEFGVAVVPMDRSRPEDVTVRGNLLEGNTVDLVWWDGEGGCFEGNSFSSSHPADIESVLPCSSGGPPAPTVPPLPFPASPAQSGRVPEPPAQPNIPVVP